MVVLAVALTPSLVAVILVAAVRRPRPRHRLRFGVPVIDAGTDRELRRRYERGEISIGTNLDIRFGTAFTSADSAGAGSADQ